MQGSDGIGDERGGEMKGGGGKAREKNKKESDKDSVAVWDGPTGRNGQFCLSHRFLLYFFFSFLSSLLRSFNQSMSTYR